MQTFSFSISNGGVFLFETVANEYSDKELGEKLDLFREKFPRKEGYLVCVYTHFKRSEYQEL